MTLQYAPPGQEYLLSWARIKLRLWHQQMLDAEQSILVKNIQVSTGVRVRVTSQYLGCGRFRDSIVVFGGEADLRWTGWLNGEFYGDDASVEFPYLHLSDAPPPHREYLPLVGGEHHYLTAWSKDRSTFVAVQTDATAFADGGAVIRRSDVEYTVASVLPFWDGRGTKYRAYQSPTSQSAPAPEDAASDAQLLGHFQFYAAAVSRDGKRLVFRSSIATEACVVLTWNTATSGYDELRVAYPDSMLAVQAAVAASSDVVSALAAWSGAGFPVYTLTCAPVEPQENPAAPGDFHAPPNYAGALAVTAVQANPYDATQVLVQFSYNYISGATVVGHYKPGTFEDPTFYFDYATGGESGNVIAVYDVVAGTWSDIYSGVLGMERFYWLDISGGGSAPAWYGGTVLAGAETWAEGHFDPDGAFMFSWNAATVSSADEIINATEPDPPYDPLPITIGQTETATPVTTADLYRDGALVLSGLGVDDEVELAQVGTSGRFLLMTQATAGKRGFVWKYGTALGEDTQITADPTALSPLGLSKEGRHLLAKTVADSTWRLRADGAVAWTSGLVATDPALLSDNALVYASFDAVQWAGVVAYLGADEDNPATVADPLDGTWHLYGFDADTSGVTANTMKLAIRRTFPALITVYLMNADGTEPDPVAATPGPGGAQGAADRFGVFFGYTDAADMAAAFGITEASIVAAMQEAIDGSYTALEDLWIAGERLVLGMTLQELIDAFYGEPGHNEAEFRVVLDESFAAIIADGGTPAVPNTERLTTQFLLPQECVGAV